MCEGPDREVGFLNVRSAGHNKVVALASAKLTHTHDGVYCNRGIVIVPGMRLAVRSPTRAIAQPLRIFGSKGRPRAGLVALKAAFQPAHRNAFDSATVVNMV